MPKTRVSFTVTGETKEVIERRAYSQIAEFLQIDVDTVPEKCDIEFEIVDSPTEYNYTATIFVRVK